MLGFLPLSTEPFSSIIQELIRLESTLDSICIIDPRILTITPVDLSYIINGDIYPNLSREVTSDSSFLNDLNVEASISSEILKTLLFVNNVEIELNQLFEIQQAQNISVVSSLELNNYIDSYLVNNLLASSNLIELSKIVFYSDSLAEVSTGFNNESVIQMPNSIGLSSESELIAEKFINILSSIELSANSDLLSVSKFDSYRSVELLAEGNIYNNIKSIVENSTDLEIVGVLSSNLSITNRDIVYYILVMNKLKPFELRVLRSK